MATYQATIRVSAVDAASGVLSGIAGNFQRVARTIESRRVASRAQRRLPPPSR